MEHRYYVALSARKPGKAQGKIVGDMERSRRGAWKLMRSRENPAVTNFRSWGLPGRRAGLRLYVLKVRGAIPSQHQYQSLMVPARSPAFQDLMTPAFAERLIPYSVSQCGEPLLRTTVCCSSQQPLNC